MSTNELVQIHLLKIVESDAQGGVKKMPKSCGSNAQRKRKFDMNLPRAILLVGLSVVAAGYFMLENLPDQMPQSANATDKPVALSAATKAFMTGRESQDQSTPTGDAAEKKLQYAAVNVDRAGLRKVIAVGTLEDCIGLQNAARTLNLEAGKNIYQVECIPT